ncbi:MAG: hypothetical protein CR991_04140 [Proteobacteria bacterium]|nr:MAG: hypothetical protein CR991_04140 [Pseudomonadota bacterium]
MKQLILVAALAGLLSACSTAPALPIGKAPGAVPPQLVYDKDGDGRIHPDKLAWDRLDTFGPVPVNLRAVGNKVCQDNNFKRAVGYHPQGKDVNGNPIPGGGYLCLR